MAAMKDSKCPARKLKSPVKSPTAQIHHALGFALAALHAAFGLELYRHAGANEDLDVVLQLFGGGFRLCAVG